MQRYRERFIEGAVGRGVEREVAERVYGQIEGFSGFGFPKSHSAAFGLLAYQSTWLRVHYGPELLCALLNEQPMGFYPPDALVHEAQRRGIEVLLPGRQRQRAGVPGGDQGAAARLGGNPPVRIGLGYVAEVAEVDAEAVIAERRRGGPYRDIADLAGALGRRRAAALRAARLGRRLRRPGATGDRARRPRAWSRPARIDRGRCGDRRSGRSEAPRAARSDDGAQLALPLDGCPRPAAAAARPLGADRRRLPDDRDDARRAPDGAAARRAVRRGAAPARASAGTRDGAAVTVAGHGRRPPASGDRQGRRLHAARGRAGHGQPDRAAARGTSAAGSR